MSNNYKTHVVSEHFGYPNGKLIDTGCKKNYSSNDFQLTPNKKCWELKVSDKGSYLSTYYFVGVDWLLKGEEIISVEPKLISKNKKTDCLKLLSTVLLDEKLSQYCSQLYQIKFDGKPISIAQQDDFLSPILIYHFVLLLKKIVKKGLMKSYSRKKANLNAKLKGKILVNQTIKHNHSRNSMLKTYCEFDEFNVDIVENKILKKAFSHCKKYIKEFGLEIDLNDINYINPAFGNVSENVSISDLQSIKKNPFYTEYSETLELAGFIIKRFGLNVIALDPSLNYTIPPFWVDMSMLFELYALSLLKMRFGEKVIHHFSTNKNELDYLLNDDEYKIVIDAKYKPIYKTSYRIDDIRQVAGYSRLTAVYKKLDKEYPEAIDSLIIYPDPDGIESFDDINLRKYRVDGFEGVYKIGIKIPLINVGF